MSDSGQEASPPINNLLQPDIYNRLDAQALERTRVVNTQLEERLRAQNRLLAKYRLAAERYHRRETERVRTELTQLTTALPAVTRIRDFRNKFLYGDGLLRKSSSSDSVPGLLQQQTRKKIRGVPEERCSLPFCERFFIHHLPSKRRYYKAPTPTPPPPPLVLSAREGGEGGGGVGGGVAVVVPPVMTVGDATNGPQLPNADSVHRVDDIHHTNGTDPSPGGAKVLTSRTDPTDQLSPNREPASSADEAHSSAKNGNLSRCHSGRGEGAELDRRPPARRPTRKTASLPSIGKQNVRLARSSPSLFQG